MLAVALDEAELDEYHWWINSQLETKKQKWKWSSPDKAGTIPFPKEFEQAGFKELERQIQAGMYEKHRIKLEDVKKTSGREVLYIDKERKLWTEDGEFYLDLKGLTQKEIATKTKKFMVIPRG